jgi:hypothetical protein
VLAGSVYVREENMEGFPLIVTKGGVKEYWYPY